jgi:hypothetical protein
MEGLNYSKLCPCQIAMTLFICAVSTIITLPTLTTLPISYLQLHSVQPGYTALTESRPLCFINNLESPFKQPTALLIKQPRPYVRDPLNAILRYLILDTFTEEKSKRQLLCNKTQKLALYIMTTFLRAIPELPTKQIFTKVIAPMNKSCTKG